MPLLACPRASTPQQRRAEPVLPYNKHGAFVGFQHVESACGAPSRTTRACTRAMDCEALFRQNNLVQYSG